MQDAQRVMGVFQTYDGPFEQRDNKRAFDTLMILADALKIALGESCLGELQGEEKKQQQQQQKKFPKYPPLSACEVESDNCNTFVLGVQLQK